MDTLMTFFGLPVTAFGLGCAGALLLLLALLGAWNATHGVAYGATVRFAVLAIPLAWLFARLFYVLANCTYYLTTLSNPMLALRFWDGGYAVTGAIAGLLLAGRLTEKSMRLGHGKLLDPLSVCILPALAVERLCEAGTGMGMGRAIYSDALRALPFCAVMDETGELVHAVYRYEAAAALLLLLGIAVWLLCRRRKPLPGGDVALTVLTLLGSAQVLLESLRNDGHMVVHFVRINQVLAMLLPVIALIVWSRRLIRAKGTWKGTPLICWIAAVCGLALGIVQEFRIDSSENLFLDYGIMAVCLIVIAGSALVCRYRSSKTAG